MLFNGYRFINKDSSIAVMHFSDDFDDQLTERRPYWPTSLEEAIDEEITERDFELMHHENDVFLIVGVDDKSNDDLSFLEDLAALSTAKCKVLLCNKARKFKKIKGYDAVITASDLTFAMNDLIWAIVSTTNNGLIGVDEADIITVILSGKTGQLKSYGDVASESDWEESYDESKKYLKLVNNRKNLAAVFTGLTLPNGLNYQNCINKVISRKTKLPDDLVTIVGGSILENSCRYQPQGLIDLIMFK